jgi:hypothetical protein
VCSFPLVLPEKASPNKRAYPRKFHTNTTVSRRYHEYFSFLLLLLLLLLLPTPPPSSPFSSYSSSSFFKLYAPPLPDFLILSLLPISSFFFPSSDYTYLPLPP